MCRIRRVPDDNYVTILEITEEIFEDDEVGTKSWLKGATPNLHFSHLHDSILHAQPYTPQVYTVPNLHDPQIYTTHIYTLKFTRPPNLHKIYTTPHLHKSNLHSPKSTQNKLANLV